MDPHLYVLLCPWFSFLYHIYVNNFRRWNIFSSSSILTPPIPKKWGSKIILLKNKKKIKIVQNCMKWREIWLNTILGYLDHIFLWANSFLWTHNFYSEPHLYILLCCWFHFPFILPCILCQWFQMGDRNLLKNKKKIKKVQNCLKWQEIWLNTILGYFYPTPKKWEWKEYSFKKRSEKKYDRQKKIVCWGRCQKHLEGGP